MLGVNLRAVRVGMANTEAPMVSHSHIHLRSIAKKGKTGLGKVSVTN